MLDYDLADVALRMMAAMAAGMAIGLNRDLKGKPLGMRTLGLVALSSALVCIITSSLDIFTGHPDAMSRVVQGAVQGVLAGIGFLGAGVILRDRGQGEVHNLTTAATVWIAAVLGIACAFATWRIMLLSAVLAVVLLVLGGPLEHWIVRKHAAMTDKRPSSPAD